MYVFAKEMCQKHYTRNRNHGSPHVVKQIVGEDRYNNPLYKSYHAMLDRCSNENNTAYKYYGGRGIKVCKRWQGLKGFSNFIKDMGERPKGLTLDRIDNSKSYSPSNCRWTDRSTQQLNRRAQSNNTSGTIGVTLYKATGKWAAQIYIKGKKRHLGYFEEKEDAVRTRQQALAQGE